VQLAHAKDVAVQAGAQRENSVAFAAGPETLFFEELPRNPLPSPFGVLQLQAPVFRQCCQLGPDRWGGYLISC